MKIEEIKQKYLELYPNCGMTEENIDKIEDKLDIKLPYSFKEILNFYDGYYSINNNSFFSFDPNEEGWNVVDKNLYYRNCDLKLPKRFLIIKEGDEDVIVLDLANENGQVYWISSQDVYNLVNGDSLTDNPTIFPTFADFFEYLLDEEEKLREESV